MSIRSEFPQLNLKVNDFPFVYLDNAATTLKPQSVIDRVHSYNSSEIANIHRGAHYFGDLGTTNYEGVREKVKVFLNASSAEEIVFTRGTTESINLIAACLGSSGFFRPGDTIVLTEMEHHSNIVPWQLLQSQWNLNIEVIPVTSSGDLDLETAKQLLERGPKLLSCTHLSNALGTLNPLKELMALAKKSKVLTVVDGAQAVAAMPVDIQDLDCDFYAFSGHKLWGPTGIGVLYGKASILRSLPPYQGGGSMISEVDWKGTSFLPPPQRFEAGTPNIGGALGLGAALDFVNQIGFAEIQKIESQLMQELLGALQKVDGVQWVGTPRERRNVVSFLLEGAHPSDVGSLLDQQGVAVRAGHHCCQPLMKRFKIPGTVRASLSIYNTSEDIDRFRKALMRAREILL